MNWSDFQLLQNMRQFKRGEMKMSIVKEEVKVMIDRLPDGCSMEDIQYHLYVVKKINRGINRAGNEGNSVDGPQHKLVT